MSVIKWREITWMDFRELKKEDALVVLPIGTVEQHGPHLPVGTDGFVIEKLAEEVCSRLDDVKTILLPSLWASKSNEHSGFPGVIGLSRDTLMGLIDDICSSVVKSGFRKLVIFNGHGGNTDVVALMLRDLGQKYPLILFDIDITKLKNFSSLAPSMLQQDAYDIHAGYGETSMMMAKYPGLVKKMDLTGVGGDFHHGKMSRVYEGYRHLAPEGGNIMMTWKVSDLSTDGVVGDPSKANPDMGQKIFENYVAVACEMMREIATFQYEDSGR